MPLRDDGDVHLLACVLFPKGKSCFAAAASVGYTTVEPSEAEPLIGYDSTAALHTWLLARMALFSSQVGQKRARADGRVQLVAVGLQARMARFRAWQAISKHGRTDASARGVKRSWPEWRY